MDEKDILTIKIEEAKSWFVLAQLIMILAGFMFAGGGIASSNSIGIFNKLQESLSSSLKDLLILQINLWEYFIIFGSALTISSLVLFIIGKYQLSKLKKR